MITICSTCILRIGNTNARKLVSGGGKKFSRYGRRSLAPQQLGGCLESPVERRDILAASRRHVGLATPTAANELGQSTDDLSGRIYRGQVVGHDAYEHRLSVDFGPENPDSPSLEPISQVVAKRFQPLEVVGVDAAG